jgi:hypothetical protein
MEQDGGKKCLWINLLDRFEGCFEKEVTCSQLPYVVCEEYLKGSEEVPGLTVVDTPCIFNG